MRTAQAHKVLIATIITDSTFSTAINIKGWPNIGIEVPTIAVGMSTDSCNVYVNVCQTSDGTFRRLKDMGVYSASSGIDDWETPSSIGNYTVLCRPVAGFTYMKLETGSAGSSVTATAALSCNIHVFN